MILRQKSGFTLLEVLIVVAIIIIIAGIAMPRFLGVSDQGKEARARGDLRVLQSAVESYILNTNTIPADDTTVGAALEGATPNVVSDYPAFKDPFSVNAASAYKYFSKTNTTTGAKYYVFFSIGKDTTAGITGIGTDGKLTGTAGDDIFVTNGKK